MNVEPLASFPTRTGTLAAAVFAVSVSASSALAVSPLNEEKHINGSLIAAAIGELIRRNCSTISPRYFVVFRKVKALERYAKSLGYTDAQIDAFLDDPDEKKRVRTAAETYLEKQGVVKGDEATYCAAGRKEIAERSLTGQLLRSRN